MGAAIYEDPAHSTGVLGGAALLCCAIWHLETARGHCFNLMPRSDKLLEPVRRITPLSTIIFHWHDTLEKCINPGSATRQGKASNMQP